MKKQQNTNPYGSPKESKDSTDWSFLQTLQMRTGRFAVFGIPISGILVSATLPAPHYVPWIIGVITFSVTILSFIAAFVWILLWLIQRMGRR